MGTRNLEVVILGGEIRVAQYCQWDGYPDGQGMTVLDFLREEMNLETFKTKVLACSWIKEKELKKLWVSVGASPKSDMVSMDISKKFSEKYPWLHRDCGAKVLKMIQDSESGLQLQNDANFAGDSIFCEWAYVIDLDKNALEVYKGFNNKQLTENDRFYSLQESDSEYYPIKMVKSYSLENLPEPDDFVADFKEEEEA